MFQALPPYFGGKRRLVGEIFKHVPPPAEAPVFIDAFLGGGSVSLYAKARGYEVLANDIAERSHIVGKALIENDRTTLGKRDLLRLFLQNGTPPGFVERRYCPDVFTSKHARFLDLALANIRGVEGTKRWLLLLLAIKYMFRMRPMGNFGAKTIVHQMEEGRWEEMNPHYVRDALTRRITSHPRRNAETLRQQINRGVFSNARANRVWCLDVFEFLPQVEGDVVYFDPPYYGTMAYESALKVVDNVLRGEELPPDPSVFSREGALGFVERMFDLARHIPLWVMSFGNAKANVEELVSLMRKFRPHVEAKEIAYVHCTGLASAEHRERNRELVLVGAS